MRNLTKSEVDEHDCEYCANFTGERSDGKCPFMKCSFSEEELEKYFKWLSAFDEREM